jgi:PilZ domain
LDFPNLIDTTQKGRRPDADRSFISNILRETAKVGDIWIAVLLIGTDISGRSRILNLYASEILMHQTTPPEINSLFKPGAKLDISFPFYGGLFKCLTNFVRFQDAVSRDFFISMPERIELLQRRRYPRTPTSYSLPIKVLSIDGSTKWRSANVEDISKGGIGISFPTQPVELIQDDVFEVEIQIARLTTVKVKVRKRDHHQRFDGRVLIGGEFEETPREMEMALSVYIHSQMSKDSVKPRSGL